MNVKNRFKKLHKEDGNSFLLFIFLMPVLCGAFGLGIDASLGNYTRTGIQNAADTATVAGAAQTAYSGNRKVIDLNKARATAISTYNEHRNQYPNIKGKSPAINVSLVGGRGNGNALQMTVQEKSPTVFLHIVGVPEFTYNIKSQARLGFNRE